MKAFDKRSVSRLTLEELFPNTLTDTSCVYIDKGREVWVATEMCAQYLESVVDSIVVVDDNHVPLGIVGGYDLLDNLRKNPTRDFQYETKVEEIMFKVVPEVEKKTKLEDLIEKWKDTRRAFAIIPNELDGYSPISARKMLEIGAKCKTDISVSSMAKKKIVTFQPDDTLGKIIDLMFEHKTRKLVLKNSNQFISDRLILGEISRILKFQTSVEYFLDIPASQLKFEYVKTVTEDLTLDSLCSIMEKMGHPYVMYKDILVSPWDVCLTLLSENLREPLRVGHQKKCPHCGKDI
ncbi:CBS domain-containing protein [Candidatus Nitrosotenuis chungbukensis]|uniref:CBS domain-containing protein n=1 Tax=Candidatus Nitrosotenuis chungbukensis TaxID=1353246 RepID=UPI000694255A|nr:CBS domain-containing protein [Candidatus Nitrosotenuis chungbukensis]WKT58008.1 CBS domain-containing protein [Candidatus Nitrosotenuis chungbukensis]